MSDQDKDSKEQGNSLEGIPSNAAILKMAAETRQAFYESLSCAVQDIPESEFRVITERRGYTYKSHAKTE